FPYACVAECCKCGETKYAEICQCTYQSQRNSAYPRIRTAQHAKTIGRSPAAECLTSERLHRQIRRVRQSGHRNNGNGRVKNCAESRYGHDQNNEWLSRVKSLNSVSRCNAATM